jgi:uncharacterized protein YcbX
MAEIVGTVAGLARYPVKSMAGEVLAEAELRWSGLHGDRQYSFYRPKDQGRFPWLSARDLSSLVLYAAAYVTPEDPRHSRVQVTDPEGERHDLHAPALTERLSREMGTPLALLQVGRGTFDAMPVSVMSSATHKALDGAHGTALDARRFRSNILIDSPQRETDWCGGRLVVGDGPDAPQLLVNDPVPRCALITIDPDTALRDPAILRTVVKEFDNSVGAYCAAARPGRIRVGDVVRWHPMA